MILGIIANFTKENIITMESKLNSNAVNRYCEEFSKIICDRFFATNTKISGEEILSLTNVRQINLFAVRTLFDTWKRESVKWESPYFDFTSEEVRKSLRDFLNLLSKNISVKRENFEPILKQAVKQTIEVLFAPYDFFMHEIGEGPEKVVTVKNLQNASKYIKINDQFYQALVKRFVESGRSEFPRQQARIMLDEVFSEFPGDPEDSTAYISGLSEVLPLKVNDIFSQAPAQREEFTMESFPGETVNEIHSNKISETVGDALKKLNRNSIRSSISLNQKFMFVNSLFKGDNEKFEQTLIKIEGMNSRQEIIHFLDETVSAKNEWDPESEEVMEFYELVVSRFD